MARPSGSVKIFRFAGIDVYLHWMWAIVAYIQVKYRYESYTSPGWALLEYVSLFAIVLLHEYGHALACRSVGGRAETILLWPLGGVAFVQPPMRAGAYLWSIAAGPLVNVALLFPTWGAVYLLRGGSGDLFEYVRILAFINTALLIFNMLPIYPLDGGQVLRALIWFFAGPANSLLIAAMIGLSVSAVALLVTLRYGQLWLALISAYAAFQSWQGLTTARQWIKWQQWPRHALAACPRCLTRPPVGEFWACESCGQPFDMVANAGRCPRCGQAYGGFSCPECRAGATVADWFAAAGQGTAAPRYLESPNGHR